MAAAVLLLAAAAAAGHASSEGVRRPEFTNIQLGRLLLEAGRLQDARAFLEQARPADEDEAIARLFLLGRIEMQLGLPRAAARRFEAILARRPNLTRVRLELATAYYATDRDDKARYHFERSMADRLPSSVEAEVRRFLDQIDNRKRWSGAISLALAPESNPAQLTRKKTVRIGGAPFQVDSRAASGTGVLISGGISFSPVIDDGLRGVLAATGSAKLYRRRDWNDVSIAGDIGLALPFDRSNISGGLRIGRRWFDDDGYSRSIGPWTRGSLRVSGNARFGVASDLLRIDHDDRPDGNGWRWTVRPSLFHALSSRTSLEAELHLEASTARTKRLGSRMAGLSLTFTHAFEGGISVSPGFAVHRRQYGDRDPIFNKTRADTTIRSSLKILHRSLQYEGFAPYAGYTFETNRSSLPNRSYRNHAVLFGISQAF